MIPHYGTSLVEELIDMKLDLVAYRSNSSTRRKTALEPHKNRLRVALEPLITNQVLRARILRTCEQKRALNQFMFARIE